MTEIRNSSDMLLAHGISPTYQRVLVLRFLRYHMPHPRAEDIYAFMQRKRLSLSRATVYNVLALFVKHGLVREIRLATGGLRYDLDQSPHGHSLCEGCGLIADVPSPLCPLHQGDDLAGFLLREQELTYKGLCPDCRFSAKHSSMHENRGRLRYNG